MYASFDFVKKIVPGTSTSFVVPAPPPFPMAGASADFWFTTSQYYDGGTIAVTDDLSTTRASVGYATTSTGTLTQFGSNVLRITDLGLLCEDARTNVVLWNRDLTNGVWTPTNITPLLDQTGPDGSVNSASSLLATAANATILQSITLASSARFQSAYVKRLTGSGTINMTMDNGATWTAITVTSNWTVVSVPTQTLANPVVGFQIVTSGDKIAVDFVQNEDGSFGSSPIPTTTTSATRASDTVTLAGGSGFDTFIKNKNTTLYVDSILNVTAAGRATVYDMIANGGSALIYTNNNNSQVSAVNGTVSNFDSGAWTTGAKCALSYDASNFSIVGNNGPVGTSVWVISTDGAIIFGTSLFGYIRRVVGWNTRLSDAAIQALTAP